MFFPTMCTGYEETAGPELPEKWGVVHVCGSISYFSCQPIESYAGYLTPCGGLGSNGATMASPFFPEFPGSEHWPRVRGHTADV